jgi:hypothetical protein
LGLPSVPKYPKTDRERRPLVVSPEGAALFANSPTLQVGSSSCVIVGHKLSTSESSQLSTWSLRASHAAASTAKVLELLAPTSITAWRNGDTRTGGIGMSGTPQSGDKPVCILAKQPPRTRFSRQRRQEASVEATSRLVVRCDKRDFNKQLIALDNRICPGEGPCP